ncbi:MAG: 4-hydroxythreonine-4-phosphate dehydrogenase PdxA [Thermodesulfobacteriota bacterium]|nr:4-hydroxythreonine-4-phosphate dehydrogenase PdxA [Thermodesulfobacteriota bacterium]
MDQKPVIGITMGDPVGVGPEIILKTLNDTAVYEICRPLVIGDPAVLSKAGKVTGIERAFVAVDRPADPPGYPEGIAVLVPDNTIAGPHAWGAPTPESGRHMEGYIRTAVDLALAGEIQAMVTCPISKAAMKLGDSRFAGHTELLAEQTGADQYAMMFVGGELRVVLVTIHIPLRAVPDTLTREKVLSVIQLTIRSMKERFHIAVPRICVAGLNPHAGEDGMFGTEEAEVIMPAVEAARQESNAEITGPLPPDTVFYKANAGMYDAVVCMYHDQGLIPFKMLHFEDGVNTTLGLPIIRTSVDHGTAYDIAGTGKASPGSLLAALRLAVDQVENLQ